MATNLNVTELDFDQIKQNLKNYLKTQTEFSGYDFEGSGLSTLLDVLAYNTHYNAMAAHFSLNEACLLYTSPSPRDQRGSGVAGWG